MSKNSERVSYFVKVTHIYNCMRKLLKAVFIITGFTMIDRILGFGFKIYLARQLGEVNFGIYQVALSTFFVLLTFTTSGIPLIVSKLTAISKKNNDRKTEGALVAAALVSGVGVSLVICAIFILFQAPIGGIFATAESMNLLLLMLPALIFSGVYAAFRGNMWGRRRYVTVSVIELIEQVTRIALVILFALMGFNLLRITAISMSVALGVTALCTAAAFFKDKGKLQNPKAQFKPLLKQAVPVTFIRASNTLVGGLLSIVVPFLLTRTGLSTTESLAVFGASVGMAMPLLFLPLTVVGSLAYVLIPSLSASYAAGDKKSVQTQIESAIAFSVVVASFFIPIFFALGEPIGLFVYGNASSGRFLSISAWLLIPIALESIVSSMMNSINLEKQSFFNYLIGAALMFGMMFATGSHFRIEFLSFGLGLAWTLSSILDIIAIKKRTGIKIGTFLVPLIKCVALIIPAAFITRGLYSLLTALPIVLRIMLPSIASLSFFGGLSLVFGVLDLSLIFKGSKKRTHSVAQNRVDKKRAKLAKSVKNKQAVVQVRVRNS